MTPKTSSERPARELRQPRRFFALTTRILALNVVALAILVGGMLYLDRFRTGLVETRLSALLTQADVIAGAIGEAATRGTEGTEIDVKLARQIIARLVVPAEVRARLFATDGALLVDSQSLIVGRTVEARPLPPPGIWSELLSRGEKLYESIVRFLARGEGLERYTEADIQRAEDYSEAVAALAGGRATMVRTTDVGTLMLSAAVPVQRFKRVLGTLMVTVETTEIEEMVRQERLEMLELFAIALAVTTLLSWLLARTIARPIHHLADAAGKVRRGHWRDIEIPDYSRRRDEIGILSVALRDMIEALIGRIDAIETFAADVAHEIKNPLTSLRSAVETLTRTEVAESQKPLLDIIKDDVRRIDRLISDIADASRIDAEMSRARMVPVDVGAMLSTLAEVYRATADPATPAIELSLPDDDRLLVRGVESRLGQVARNLLDNAISFSRTGKGRVRGPVRVVARREDDWVVITVDDQGPGIPEGMQEHIFERFYTERPEGEQFGEHSGLGLSICKQIVEAHGGIIEAQNRPPAPAGGENDAPEPGDRGGARFIVRFPT